MPLEHSSSDAALHRNMHTLMGEIGKSPHVQSRKQAIAIALETQRRGGRDTGGVVGDDEDQPQTGKGNVMLYQRSQAGTMRQIDRDRAQGRADGGVAPPSGNPFAVLAGLDAMDATGIAPSYAAGGGAPADPVQSVISALQQGSGNSASPMASGYPGAGMGVNNTLQPSSPMLTAMANPTSVASGVAPSPTNPAAMGVATQSLPTLAMMQKRDGGAAKLAIGGFDIAKGQTPGVPWFERSEARQLHTGPVLSHVPGRSDNHQIKVPSGSYVLPAQHVASMGHGNTLAGMSLAHSMFGGYVPGGGGIPHGHLPRPPRPGFAAGGVSEGGAREGHNGFEAVPVDVSGGEYIIPPWAIIRRYGSLKNGHKILDRWIMDTRKEEIKTQKKLPPPATRWIGGGVWAPSIVPDIEVFVA
jgi:hypothetical protein